MRPIERTAFTLDEAAVSSAIGREQLEEWIYSGELPAFKVGKKNGKTIIPADSLRNFLRNKAEAREGMPPTSPVLRKVLEDRRKKRGGGLMERKPRRWRTFLRAEKGRRKEPWP